MTEDRKNASPAAEQLRLFIERVERLKEEIKALNEDVRDVYAEAKANGFDAPTMRNVIKLRKMEPSHRHSSLALVELYLTALGMSDGSLSDMAVAFLEERSGRAAGEVPEEPEVDQQAAPNKKPKAAAGAVAGEPDVEPDAPPLTVDDARKLGHDAGLAGKPVTTNPFPARDPRRAAWDEEWCKAAGSDGMEIPEFLRAPPKPVDPKPKPKGAGK